MHVLTSLPSHDSLHRLLSGRRAWKGPGKAAVAALVLSGAVIALPSSSAAEDWEVALGPGVSYEPEYPGANDYTITPMPFVDVTWRDRVFLRSERGLGAYAVNWENPNDGLIKAITFGASIRPSESRDEDDDDRLDGLGDIDLSAEVGLLASIQISFVELEAELYQDVGNGHEGLLAEISAGVGVPVTERLSLGLESFAQLGDGQYLESFFGVTGRQAARSQFARYDAGSGLYAAGLGLSGRYQITESWSVLSMIEYSRLVGDAADSPIVEEEGAVEVGAFVAYRF